MAKETPKKDDGWISASTDDDRKRKTRDFLNRCMQRISNEGMKEGTRTNAAAHIPRRKS